MTPKEDELAAATAYQDLHVPALFRQWAPRVVRAARIQPGDRVLDVACGTGVLAIEALSAAGQSGRVVGIDPGEGMLSVASGLEPNIEWRSGVAEELPFEKGSFDAVVSQFGLMFFSDRTKALREMLRVLSSDGRISVAVWDSLENSESYAIEVNVLDQIGGRRAGDALRAPFVLGDRNELGELFGKAGAQSIEIQTHVETGRFPSVRTMVEADLRGWLPVMGVVLDEETIAEILAEAETALARFVTPNGSVVFDSPAHVVTATA